MCWKPVAMNGTSRTDAILVRTDVGFVRDSGSRCVSSDDIPTSGGISPGVSNEFRKLAPGS